jgi:hypothetical protein
MMPVSEIALRPGPTQAAAAINERIAKLMGRFGYDGAQLLLEAAASPPDTLTLLRHPALIDERGLIQLHAIGTMDALLEMATGGQPAISPPKQIQSVRTALLLFLKLNHTREFCWREGDTPDAWSTRIMDALFLGLAQRNVLSHADFMALDRISTNPLWQALFAYALGLFLSAVADPKRVVALDNATASSAVQAFKASATVRQARLPKMKYGNPLSGFKELAEYAIGEYLGGLDVNDALARTLVRSQLGTKGEDGKERFEQFLRDNRIAAEMFPTTVAVLFDMVQKLCRFQESEGEVAAVCHAYSQEHNETVKIERIFANFADAVFPIAAKFRKQFYFGNLSAHDSAQVLARWARRSRTLAQMRQGGLAKQVQGLVSTLSSEERQALLAFRDGRTTTKSIGPVEVQGYVRTRRKLLTLSAQQAKIARVETLLRQQVNGAEQFILRPGQEALQDMTYGIDVFFRTLRTVLEDICDGTGAMMRDQMQVLSEFQRRYGPLAQVSLLYPMKPNQPADIWMKEARTALARVDGDAFVVA